jgi:3-isopropylmalate/(R)-2-methylmalate dehydratase small subunit
MSAILGRARVLPGPISTDDMLPAKYKHRSVDPADLAPHIFENVHPGFAESVREPTILVCRGGVMGIGSSREQAVTALRAAGVMAVLSHRFGRIFFRNCWNVGLPALELMEGEVEEGETLTVDLAKAQISGRGTEARRCRALDPRVWKLHEAGGLLNGLRSGQIEW